MYLSKCQIVFVQIANCICPNKKNISGPQYAQVQDSCDGEGQEGDGGGGRGEEQEERQESFDIKKSTKNTIGRHLMQSLQFLDILIKPILFTN